MTSTLSRESLGTGATVSFTCEGCRLFGSLHQPGRPDRNLPAIILLNQGPVDRAGSHRLYVKLAWRLTARGFTVLRFDARGVGESEGLWAGEPGSISILDSYGEIQRGAWVPDALAAIEFLTTQTPAKRVILGGLCGGAATAVLAAAHHSRVDGAFVIGTPVTFSSVTRQVSALPEAIIQRDTRQYLAKLLNPRSWVRLLSLQTDYRTLLDVFTTQVRRRLRRVAGDVTPGLTDDNINVPLIDAIRASKRNGKRLLLIFGENDYLWHEFQEQLPRFGASKHLPFELATIADANHTLTEAPWQEALYQSVLSWLEGWTSTASERKRQPQNVDRPCDT